MSNHHVPNKCKATFKYNLETNRKKFLITAITKIRKSNPGLKNHEYLERANAEWKNFIKDNQIN